MDSHVGILGCPLKKIKPSTPGLPCWISWLSIIKNKTQYTWTSMLVFLVVRYKK